MILWEIAGWLLLVTGLYVFSAAFALLMGEPAKVIEPAGMTVIAIFIFRGGIHLLKIAAAARVCREMAGLAVKPGAEAKARKPGVGLRGG